MNLYISDLDGTLLNSSGQLTAESYRNLNLFYEQNIQFSIATARSIVTIIEALENNRIASEGLKFHLPIIEYNGAYVTDYNTRTILAVEEIEKTVLTKVFAEAQGMNVAQITGGNNRLEKDFDKRYFCNISEVNNKGIEEFYRNRKASGDKRITFSADTFASDNQVVGLTFIDRREKLSSLENFIKKHYSDKINTYLLQDEYNDKSWFWLLVQSKNATKGKAIQKILQLQKIQSYHLTVFGDNWNDVEMFAVANTALATQNAIDEIKKIADGIIGHNDEHSVINYIKKQENIVATFANRNQKNTGAPKCHQQ